MGVGIGVRQISCFGNCESKKYAEEWSGIGQEVVDFCAKISRL